MSEEQKQYARIELLKLIYAGGVIDAAHAAEELAKLEQAVFGTAKTGGSACEQA